MFCCSLVPCAFAALIRHNFDGLASFHSTCGVKQLMNALSVNDLKMQRSVFTEALCISHNWVAYVQARACDQAWLHCYSKNEAAMYCMYRTTE